MNRREARSDRYVTLCAIALLSLSLLNLQNLENSLLERLRALWSDESAGESTGRLGFVSSHAGFDLIMMSSKAACLLLAASWKLLHSQRQHVSVAASTRRV